MGNDTDSVSPWRLNEKASKENYHSATPSPSPKGNAYTTPTSKTIPRDT